MPKEDKRSMLELTESIMKKLLVKIDNAPDDYDTFIQLSIVGKAVNLLTAKEKLDEGDFGKDFNKQDPVDKEIAKRESQLRQAGFSKPSEWGAYKSTPVFSDESVEITDDEPEQ